VAAQAAGKDNKKHASMIHSQQIRSNSIRIARSQLKILYYFYSKVILYYFYINANPQEDIQK
jgi:hypothetical protein